MVENQKTLSFKALLYYLYHKDKRKFLVQAIKKLHQYLLKNKPMSLQTAFLLSRIASKNRKIDGIFIKDDLEVCRGSEIKNSDLSRIFNDVVLDPWALDVETINYLEKDINKFKPRKILEFGSGISTVCLVKFLINLHGTEPIIRVYSVEQDEKYFNSTKNLIKDHGLEKFVKIIYSPLTVKQIEGVECNTYALNDLDKILDNVEVDYCLIDGPSVTEFGGRLATLPMIREFANENQMRFVLDDALRAKELLIAKKWKRLPYINIQGIILTPKGLLTGFLKR